MIRKRMNVNEKTGRFGRKFAFAGLLLPLLVLFVQTALGSPHERIEQGKRLATDRSKGNCLACHMMGDGELPGNIGPPLLAMKLRFPERSGLTAQVCDASVRNPDSRMPPFCRHGVLTSDEVELIVDYLYTL